MEHVGTGDSPVHAERSSVAICTIGRNHNAAAAPLALTSPAEGGEVSVSRGETGEIGGSFRIPDVMSKSQATLRESGTQNAPRIAASNPAITVASRFRRV